MIIFYIFGSLFALCVAIYIGLHMSEDIKNSYIYILFWILYIIALATIVNVIMSVQFYGVIKNKIGPPGPRGSVGDSGEIGMAGLCGDDCAQKNVYSLLLKNTEETINNIGYYVPGAKINRRVKINNVFIKEKIKQISYSYQYHKVANMKGRDKTNSYLQNILNQWM